MVYLGPKWLDKIFHLAIKIQYPFQLQSNPIQIKEHKLNKTGKLMFHWKNIYIISMILQHFQVFVQALYCTGTIFDQIVFSILNITESIYWKKMDWTQLISVSLFFILLTVFLLKTNSSWNNNSQNLPPRPRILPFLGNLHIMDMKRPHRTMLKVMCWNYDWKQLNRQDKIGSRDFGNILILYYCLI